MRLDSSLVAQLLVAARRRARRRITSTVAGLGGEPDYEQRFTANAMDLDKVFKAAVNAHVVTLTGKDSTKAKLSRCDGAGGARGGRSSRRDDLVLTLIRTHGSFDGTEYKFNLSGAGCDRAREIATSLCEQGARRSGS